jgi:acyl dehydratase
MFAALTGDWHPIHTNVEYAKNTQFGERIAHGMLTLVIGGALAHRMGPYVYSPKGFIAFYGMDNIRFTVPLKIGDTIRCELTVKNLEPKDNKRGNLVYQTDIFNQRDELLMTASQKLLVGRKPKG